MSFSREISINSRARRKKRCFLMFKAMFKWFSSVGIECQRPNVKALSDVKGPSLFLIELNHSGISVKTKFNGYLIHRSRILLCERTTLLDHSRQLRLQETRRFLFTFRLRLRNCDWSIAFESGTDMNV